MQVRATCKRLAKAVKEIDHGRDWEYLSAEKTLTRGELTYHWHIDRLHFGNAHLFALDHTRLSYDAFFRPDPEFSCTPVGNIFMHDLHSVDWRRLVGSVTLSDYRWGSEWYSGIKHLKVQVFIPVPLSEFFLMTPFVQVYEFEGSTFDGYYGQSHFALSEREAPLCFRKLRLCKDHIPALGNLIVTIRTLYLCMHGLQRSTLKLDRIVRCFPNVNHLQCMLHTHRCLHSARPSLTEVTFFEKENVRRPKSKRLRRLFPNATVVYEKFAPFDSLHVL